MRYLSAACPEIRHVLLVESCSRPLLEAAIPRLRNVFGPSAGFTLVTCFPGTPPSLEASAIVLRTQDYPWAASRAALIRELAGRIDTIAIVCSAEPIMNRWKWWLAWKLPAKVLIVNENADCFWLDTANLRTLCRLMLVRIGLSGGDAGRMLARLARLPFVVAYLLLYATIVHARRALRVAFPRRFP